MNRVLFSVAILFALSTVFGQGEVLTNADLIQMLKSGFSEEVIALKISVSKCRFDTTLESLAELKDAGASDALLAAVLKTALPKAGADEQVEQLKEDLEVEPSIPIEPIVCPDLPVANVSSVAPTKNSLKAMQGSVYRLKTHKAVFGSPARVSPWDMRPIYETRIFSIGEQLSIGGNHDWQLSYFVSGQPYIVKDAKLKEKGTEVEIKLHATNENVGTELKLTFSQASMFSQSFHTIFFAPSEDEETYETAVNCRLAEQFIDPHFDTAGVTLEEKVAMIKQLKAFSGTGQPEIVAEEDGAYPRVRVFDYIVYNTLQVDKNQRISSTLESVMKWAKAKVSIADLSASKASDLFRGYIFYWEANYRNFLKETQHHSDRIELSILREDFISYIEGDLSIYELVQQSILRVNGDKYTLTEYDPIGAVS